MIRFTQHGTTVKTIIEIDKESSKEIYFYWECGANNQLYSQLLSELLQKRLSDRIESIRKEEYERGWREAKSKKKPKSQWFSSTMRLLYTK